MAYIIRNFYTSRIQTTLGTKMYSEKRIKPHNIDLISVLVANLLGDGLAEKRNNATRFHIHVSSRNAEYIFSMYSFFKEKKYCSAEKPKVKKQIGKNNSVVFSIKFRTFSFSNLNYIYDCFYVKQKTNESFFFKKVVPKNISSLLTEKALAIWFMDKAGKSQAGVKFSTESFCYADHILLQQTILQNFNLHCTVEKHKHKFILYFKKSEKEKLSEIIKPYMLASMYYKLQ